MKRSMCKVISYYVVLALITIFGVCGLKGTSFAAYTQVNTYTGGDQSRPSAAMDPSGNFVIAWDGVGPGDGAGIYAQRYDNGGNPVGTEFQVNTYTTSSQGSPSVAMDPSGNFVIAWDGAGPGDGAGIYAQRYDNGGNPVGTEFQVNTYTTSSQGSPSVAIDPSGNFVIAWDGAGPGDGAGNIRPRDMTMAAIRSGLNSRSIPILHILRNHPQLPWTQVAIL